MANIDGLIDLLSGTAGYREPELPRELKDMEFQWRIGRLRATFVGDDNDAVYARGLIDLIDGYDKLYNEMGTKACSRLLVEYVNEFQKAYGQIMQDLEALMTVRANATGIKFEPHPFKHEDGSYKMEVIQPFVDGMYADQGEPLTATGIPVMPASDKLH